MRRQRERPPRPRARRRRRRARRQEAARKPAEAAKKASEAAAKKLTAAESAPKKPAPTELAALKKDATSTAKATKDAQAKADAAAKKLQAAEEDVAAKAKAAEDAMAKANAAAKAEKKPEPYSADALKKNQLQANEVKNAFDGASARRKEDLSKLLGVDGSAKPNDIARELDADRQYTQLAGDPKNQATLAQLGIKDGKDLLKLGDRLEGQMNRKDGARRADDADFSQVKDTAALERILKGVGETRSGDAKKALTNDTFVSLVAGGASPADAKANYENLEKLGYQPSDIAALARNSANQKDFAAALKSVSTLADPKASTADKIAAAIELGDTAKNLIPPAKLEGVLGKALKGLPSAKAAVDAIGKFTDPKATSLEKAQAALALAKEVKGLAGDVFPQVADRLRKLDGTFRAAGAAMTLLDPKASVKDKALAAAQLAAELPDLKGDLSKLKDVFTRAGVADPEAIVREGDDLAQLARRGIDPALATRAQPRRSSTSSPRSRARPGPEELEKVMKNVTDKAALDKLVTQLSGLDAAGTKNAVAALATLEKPLLNEVLKDPKLGTQLTEIASKLGPDAGKQLGTALKGLDKAGAESLLKLGAAMDPDQFAKTLADPTAAENLAKTLGKLDPKSVDGLVKIAADMDADGLKTLLKFSAVAPKEALETGIRTLGPILEKGGGRLLGKALGALDAIVAKLGVELTGDVAVKVFKSLVKIAPVAGAVPNVIDAAKYTQESAELRSKNKDLGFLALVGAGLNTADAAFGIIADATGVGVLADIGGSIAFSVAELALDIGFSNEKAKMLKNPDGYQAPDWVKAVNLVGAVATAPAGVTALVGYYGLDGTKDLAMWAVEKGGELAKKAWDALKQIGGPVVEYVGEAVSKLKDLGEAGVDALKYIAENPGELGQAAVDAALGGLKDLGEAGVHALSELAKANAELAKAAVGALEDVGEAGVEALKDLAQVNEQLAELTVGALKNLAEGGLDVAKDALGGLADLGGAAADFAGDALGALGSVVSKLNPFD